MERLDCAVSEVDIGTLWTMVEAVLIILDKKEILEQLTDDVHLERVEQPQQSCSVRIESGDHWCGNASLGQASDWSTKRKHLNKF